MMIHHNLPRGQANGILYAEDFDGPPPLPAPPAAETPATPVPTPAPVFSLDELREAERRGRELGAVAERESAEAAALRRQAEAVASVAEALTRSQAEAREVAAAGAHAASAAVLRLLGAALPVVMARHAGTELDAVLRAVLPGLAQQPRVTIRLHPDQVARVRTALAALDEPLRGVIDWIEVPQMAPGDLRLSWQGGGFVRDTRQIQADVLAALALLPDTQDGEQTMTVEDPHGE